MGDERGCGIDVLARVISIHAPPRGATPPTFTPEAEKLRISIHAPPRGATAVAARFKQRYISIHAPPRGATRLYGEREVELHISIHAPPRGATTLVLASRLATLFQFTPLREGRRTQQPLMWMKKLISIHAPPRGATARASSRQQKRQHFNSRPSARGDTAGRERRTADRISIHAPPRGATRVAGHRKVSNQISIHAPPRGATTRPKGAAARNCPISIHAPPRGATNAP